MAGRFPALPTAPPIAPPIMGVSRNRTPTPSGFITKDTAGVTAGAVVTLGNAGFIEFQGQFANFEFSYGENPGEWIEFSANDVFPSPASGIIRIRERNAAAGVGVGTVKVLDWPYESGFVRALLGRFAQNSGDKAAYDNAVLAGGEKYGATFVGRSGTRSVLSFYGSSDAATTLTVQYSFNGTDYFDSEVEVVLGAAGTFAIDFLTAAPYVAFRSSANADVVANFSWR